jgi:hypothetical protein
MVLHAGENAAKQVDLKGQVLAHWFLNLDEVVDSICSAGYTCVYEGRFGGTYDESNYPDAYRHGREREVLFVRTDRVAGPFGISPGVR